MANDLPVLDIRTVDRWRAWLKKNHATSAGIWLVAHKDHTGVAAVPYEDVVRQALCFGWIDSLIKRLDEDRYARKVTPRKPSSKWSAINRKRWAELNKSGELAAAGRAAAPTSNTYAAKPTIPELPSYIAKALKTNPKAWQTFQSLAPTYRRHYVVWIHIAKQPETRERRLRESIALLAAGKKLGLK
jgi:uncharacterized protein YdeI (YjbR/CyaY-like superfamily)